LYINFVEITNYLLKAEGSTLNAESWKDRGWETEDRERFTVDIGRGNGLSKGHDVFLPQIK
jgi:hypothetical protein